MPWFTPTALVAFDDDGAMEAYIREKLPAKRCAAVLFGAENRPAAVLRFHVPEGSYSKPLDWIRMVIGQTMRELREEDPVRIDTNDFLNRLKQHETITVEGPVFLFDLT